ncbi:MAG: class I SAM-dependent RNA methyltransferase [Thermodesulfovibrionia bacterium]|nr:class I SAM-dependent RNA methyltransferase [Thermodesulfovibrionia bacterium]
MILKAEIPAYGGFSIGRHKGKAVLIRGAVVPGETVEVTIEEGKKDYYSASVRRIIEPSPYRIRPACNFFGSCGGCHLQFITYEKQVQLKEEILRDCLKRIAKIDADVSVPVLSDYPWNYRYRGQFKISQGKIGFYRERTRAVIEVDYCPLMGEEINRYIKKAGNLLRGLKAGEIHISSGDCTLAFLKLPAHTQSGTDIGKLASMFLDSGFSGLFVQAEDERLFQYGKPYITLDLENIQYTVSPMSFFQCNWRLNQAVVRFIKDSLKPLGGKKILDLYAGAGNFSLPLAVGAEIRAVEENLSAVEDGRRNVELNGMRNCRFIHSSAEDFRIEEDFQVVVLNPPRPGLTNRVIRQVFTGMPEKIVYLSCDPATFSRDLKKLIKRYDIESIQLVDFFPQTFHIETLAFLKIKKV